MQRKISIIIPVYNVELYLEQCVNSILTQSYRNYEIILVDDGSKDKSSIICDKLSKVDNRIIVIHKENGGLSDARNHGVRMAQGEYVIFLDSDDYWDDQGALLRLVERVNITNSDVLNYYYKKYNEDNDEVQIPAFYNNNMPVEYRNYKEQLQFLFDHNLYIACAWNKMIKRDILTEGMEFEKGRVSEDIEWCARLLCKAKNMDYVAECFCCYRQREGSISKTITEKTLADLVHHIEGCLNIAKESNYLLQQKLYTYTAFQYATFIAVQALVSRNQMKYINAIEKNKWVLKYHGNNKKVKIVYYLSRILGLKVLCKLVTIPKKYGDFYK